MDTPFIPTSDSTVWTVGTKTDASKFLRIKPRTLDDWIKKGWVPYSKLPSGAVRFQRDQLLEFLGKFKVVPLRRQEREGL